MADEDDYGYADYAIDWPDIGPSEDQLNEWNIANEHEDGPMDDVRWLGWLCEHCGANPGEPCDPDCADYAEEVKFHQALLDEAQADERASLLDQAQGALMGVAYRLPYSGLLDDPPIRQGIDPDVWLAKLAVWMEGYLKLVQDKVAELEAGNRRAIALQLEKDVVRGFLTGTGDAA